MITQRKLSLFSRLRDDITVGSSAEAIAAASNGELTIEDVHAIRDNYTLFERYFTYEHELRKLIDKLQNEIEISPYNDYANGYQKAIRKVINHLRQIIASGNRVYFHRLQDEQGTVYKQVIKVTTEEWKKLCDALEVEKMNPFWAGNEETTAHLKAPIGRRGKFRFVNHTQRDFFNRYLRLPLDDEDTAFYLID